MGWLICGCLAGCNPAVSVSDLSEETAFTTTSSAEPANQTDAPTGLVCPTNIEIDPMRQYAGTEAANIRKRRYASADMNPTPDQVSAALWEKLQRCQVDSSTVRKRMRAQVDRMRQHNAWLDASLNDPIDTPLLTGEGNLPGPTTIQASENERTFAGELLDEYLRYSKQAAVDQQALKECFEGSIDSLVTQRPVDETPQRKVYQKYRAANYEPLVLYLNLRNVGLHASDRTMISNQLRPAFGLRSLTGETAFGIACLINGKTLEPANRVWLTAYLIRALPYFLDSESFKVDDAEHPQHLAATIIDQFNAAGDLDYVEWMLDLYDGTANPLGDEGIVAKLKPHDEEGTAMTNGLRHEMLSRFYESLAEGIRGEEYLVDLSSSQLAEYQRMGRLATDHAIAWWTIQPGNRHVVKRLMDLETRWGGVGYSVAQLGRLAMLNHADDPQIFKTVTDSLAFAEELGQLEHFTTRVIEQTANEQAHFTFERPVHTWMNLRGRFSRIGETEVGRALIKVIESCETEQEGLERCLTCDQVALLYRAMWDAGRLDLIAQTDQWAGSKGMNDWINETGVSGYIVRSMAKTAADPNYPPGVIATLVNEFWIDDEHWDDSRLSRVDEVIATLNKSLSSESDEPGRYWQTLRDQMADYLDGKPVELIGSKNWISFGDASVSLNPGSIRIKTDRVNASLLLTYPLRFEMPFEVEMHVRQGACQDDPYGIALFVGQCSPGGIDQFTSGRSLRYAPGYQMVMQDRLPGEKLSGEHYHEQPLPNPPKLAVLKMRVRQDGVASYLNDELITDSSVSVKPDGIIQIGRRCDDRFEGVPEGEVFYQIQSVRVTRLPIRSSPDE